MARKSRESTATAPGIPLKTRLAILLIRLTGKLPLPLAQWLGRWLGLMAYYLRFPSRHSTEVNINHCFPALSPSERQQRVQNSLAESGKTMLEIPLLWEWPLQRSLALIESVEGEHLVTEALARNKGLILLAPHLGNWELAGLYFSSRFDMAAMYSPPKLPGFEDYMIRVRSKAGSELVRAERKGLARLLTLLRAGGVAGILPDQAPRAPGNAYAPFFGARVRTMTLVAKLVQKSGATALATYARRLPGQRGFQIVIREVSTDIAARDLTLAATALNQTVEQLIEESPEQYQWAYKRLRRRPPGQANPYKTTRT